MPVFMLLLEGEAVAKKDLSVIDIINGHRIFIGKNSWHYRTRFFDVVPMADGKFGMLQPKSEKYFEFTTTKDFPSYLVIPNAYRMRIEPVTKWQKLKTARFSNKNITVYKRKVKVFARKARTTLLQLEENLDKKTDTRIRIVFGTQELWVTNDFGKQEGLRKFLSVFFGCPVELGLPVRETLEFPGCTFDVNEKLIRAVKISAIDTFADFGTIPRGATRGKDLVNVLSGSGGMLEFLYQAR